MRAWIEIDTDKLRYNIFKIKELVGNRKIIGVIKANAYGLGSVEIAKELIACGVDFFGVATCEEGLELRNNGITSEILVLGSLFNNELDVSNNEGFHVSICNHEQLEYIKNKQMHVKVHLKVDTGMGRIGFLPENLECEYKYCIENNINLVGIYSHLSDADSDENGAKRYTEQQLNIFKKFEKLCGIKYLHIFNSGAITKHNNKIIGNAVRPGICMYGMLGNSIIDGFRCVFEMKCRIIYKRKIKVDTPISYGRTAVLHNGDTFVTLSVGYADGIDRNFSNKMYVIIKGVKCKIVGNICMDMCMVKLPKDIVDKVEIGDEVTVFNDEIIKDIEGIDACTWEILAGIGRRVYRIYKKNGKAYKTLRWLQKEE